MIAMYLRDTYNNWTDRQYTFNQILVPGLTQHWCVQSEIFLTKAHSHDILKFMLKTLKCFCS